VAHRGCFPRYVKRRVQTPLFGHWTKQRQSITAREPLSVPDAVGLCMPEAIRFRSRCHILAGFYRQQVTQTSKIWIRYRCS